MLVRESVPTLDGEIRFDEQARRQAAGDFGHIVQRMPAAVVVPRSGDDVAASIRWAGEQGLTFAARGRGHSVYGRSQAADAIVAEMSELRSVHAVHDDRVVVDAGATWSEVLAATLPRGLTPPVLPDYLEMSVGGTLAVGGVGGRTSRYGLVTDHVLELDVVTGTGERISCSPAQHSAVFDATRGGLGQVAVIIRATLELTPAPQTVRRLLLTYPDLATMVRDERILSEDGRFDVVQGAIVGKPEGGWAFRLDAAKEFSADPPDDDVLLEGLSDDTAQRTVSTMAYLDFLQRLSALERGLRATGQWAFPHPWLTTFVGDGAVESVVGDDSRGSTRPTSARSGRSPSRQSAVRRRPHSCRCRATACATRST